MKTVKNYRNLMVQAKDNGLKIIVGVVLLMTTSVATAQKENNWSIEARGGANFATKELGNANLKTGFGFEGALAYRFMPHLGAYVGWSWNRFAADQSFAGTNIDFEETGYFLGLQFIHPIGDSKINYMLKGGGTYNHIETENSAGDIINDTGHGFGWQIGGGITVPLGERFQLIPEVRYRSLSRKITIGETSTPVDLNYISTSVGISYSF